MYPSKAHSCVWCSKVISSGIKRRRCQNVNAHLCDVPPGCHLSYTLSTHALLPLSLASEGCQKGGVVYFAYLLSLHTM